MAGLEIKDLRVAFGGVVALDGLAFEASAGSVTAVIGPNGAGKTTLFNCISGHQRAQAGEVRFAGASWLGLTAHEIARTGVARTFQNVALFPDLSVVGNLLVGCHAKLKAGLWQGLWHWGRGFRAGREEAEQLARIERVMAMFELAPYRDQSPASLPYGVQKRVELARALLAEPRLLLLDEPAAGLTHGERQTLVRWLRAWVSEHRITVLFIEHHLDLVRDLADRVVVLDFGRLIAVGSPSEIAKNPDVQRAYLGSAKESLCWS